MTRPPVTRALAAFASKLDYDRVPAHVRDLLPVLLADWFRAGSVGVTRDWTLRAKSTLLTLSDGGTCPLLFSQEKADPVRAAYMNGVIAGSLDWDDSHIAALVHPGVVVWPAVFAAAALAPPDGKRLCEAALAGYEVAVRIGMGLQPDHALRGFQATPSCGIFGATVAASLLLGLDEDRLCDALGLAASYASGSSQFFLSGSDVKRLHAGKAAAAGVEIALLAKAGLTGPHDAIEGDQGFGVATSDSFHPEIMIGALGQKYWIDEIALKIHAGTVRLQAAIESAQALARDGVLPDQIAKVEIGVPKVLLGKVTSPDPVDMQQAQMSAPFAVAMTFHLLTEGMEPLILGLDEFERMSHDARVKDLSHRTNCVFDAEMDAAMGPGKVPARVSVTLKDGRVLTQKVFFPKGCRENPITPQEVFTRAQQMISQKYPANFVSAWLARLPKIHTLPHIEGIMI